jgi:hypothetical protein
LVILHALAARISGEFGAQISRRFAFYLWEREGGKKRVLNSHIYPLFPSQPRRLVVARVAETIFNFIAAIGKVSHNSPVASRAPFLYLYLRGGQMFHQR